MGTLKGTRLSRGKFLKNSAGFFEKLLRNTKGPNLLNTSLNSLLAGWGIVGNSGSRSSGSGSGGGDDGSST